MAKIDPKKLAQRKKLLSQEVQQKPKGRALDLSALIAGQPDTPKIKQFSKAEIEKEQEKFELKPDEISAREYMLAAAFDRTLLDPLYTTAALGNPELMDHPLIFDVLLSSTEISTDKLIKTKEWIYAGYLGMLEFFDEHAEQVAKIQSLEKQRDSFQAKEHKGDALKKKDWDEKTAEITELRESIAADFEAFLIKRGLHETDQYREFTKEAMAVDYVPTFIEPCIKALSLTKDAEEARNVIVRGLYGKAEEKDDTMLEALRTAEIGDRYAYQELASLSMDVGISYAGGIQGIFEFLKLGIRSLQQAEKVRKQSGAASLLASNDLGKVALEAFQKADERLDILAHNVVTMQNDEEKLLPPADDILDKASATLAAMKANATPGSEQINAMQYLESCRSKWDAGHSMNRSDYLKPDVDWRGKAHNTIKCASEYFEVCSAMFSEMESNITAIKAKKQQGDVDNDSLVQLYNQALALVSHTISYEKLLKDAVQAATKGNEQFKSPNTEMVLNTLVMIQDNIKKYKEDIQAVADDVKTDKGGPVEPFSRAKFQVKRLSEATKLVVDRVAQRYGGGMDNPTLPA